MDPIISQRRAGFPLRQARCLPMIWQIPKGLLPVDRPHKICPRPHEIHSQESTVGAANITLHHDVADPHTLPHCTLSIGALRACQHCLDNLASPRTV